MTQAAAFNAPQSSAPQPDPDDQFGRPFIRRWLWRIGATAIWISILGRLAPVLAIAIAIVAATAYLAFRRNRAQGCVTLVLFPFYVVGFPVLAPFLVGGEAVSVANSTARRSQHPIAVLVPYVITIVIALALSKWQSPGVKSLAVASLPLLVAFVVASLGVWVLQPLPWVLTASAWWASWIERYPRRKKYAAQFDALVANPAGDTSNLKTLLNRVRIAHSSLSKSNLRQTVGDAFMLTAFARKFFVSLLHVAALFALIHFVLNTAGNGGPAPYTGLPVGSLSDVWQAYGYFAAMTLIAGATNVAPVSPGAHAAVLVNALVGVSFLVILVTTFSMVARDRMRQAMSEIADRASATTKSIEEGVLVFVVPIALAQLIPRDAIAELKQFDVFVGVPESRKYLQGIANLHSAIAALRETGDNDDANYLMTAPADLGLSDYLKVLQFSANSELTPRAMLAGMRSGLEAKGPTSE